MGPITVKKTDAGIAWGGVHWQYLEDIAKITPHDQNPLTLKKTLFVEGPRPRGRSSSPSADPWRRATPWSSGSSCGRTATWNTST